MSDIYMKINVLGTEYQIVISTEQECDVLIGIDGYCAFYDKKIYINNFDKDPEWKTQQPVERSNRANHAIRHELIHAFLYESGLYTECRSDVSWSLNEQIIDWIAIQMPKIMKAYESVIKQHRLKHVDTDVSKPAA